jgi:hypothetical protein
MKMRAVSRIVFLGGLLAAVGCHVQVDKGKNGEDKDVRISTPLGGLHVRSDQTAAADLGLPVYPGAQIAPDHEGDKSADVHLGFGEWQLRVRVVTYQTSDARDKVVAFYRSALGRFGDVVECKGNHPVGSPTITSEGLTCDEDRGKANIHVSGVTEGDDLTLRAGSKRHQHIFAIKNGGEGTRFALVELQLPAAMAESNSRGSD